MGLNNTKNRDTSIKFDMKKARLKLSESKTRFLFFTLITLDITPDF